jgi:hypothetical protein
MCEYSSQNKREVITRDFIDGFITSNFRDTSVPNKLPNLKNEKAFYNGMYPINVQKMDEMKPAIKYTDNDHHDFGLIL